MWCIHEDMKSLKHNNGFSELRLKLYIPGFLFDLLLVDYHIYHKILLLVFKKEITRFPNLHCSFYLNGPNDCIVKKGKVPLKLIFDKPWCQLFMLVLCSLLAPISQGGSWGAFTVGLETDG